MPFEYIKSDLYRYCGNTSLKFFLKITYLTEVLIFLFG